MKLDARPTPLYLQKLSSHGAVGALPACMTTETIFDVLACCGLHTLVLVTTKTVHNDLTGCHGPKWSTWSKTDHSGGCTQPLANNQISPAIKTMERLQPNINGCVAWSSNLQYIHKQTRVGHRRNHGSESGGGQTCEARRVEARSPSIFTAE